MSLMANLDLELPKFTKRSREDEEAGEAVNGPCKKTKGGGEGGGKGSKSRGEWTASYFWHWRT